MSEVKEVTWKDWVAALRSGDYEQGTGYLQSKNGFCCWGVACHLVNPDNWHGTLDKGPLGYKDEESRRPEIFLMNFPPDSVLKALGVLGLSKIKYAAMNDRGDSFSEIADEIEKEMTARGTI